MLSAEQSGPDCLSQTCPPLEEADESGGDCSLQNHGTEEIVRKFKCSAKPSRFMNLKCKATSKVSVLNILALQFSVAKAFYPSILDYFFLKHSNFIFISYTLTISKLISKNHNRLLVFLYRIFLNHIN